jgi:hypothetical protein
VRFLSRTLRYGCATLLGLSAISCGGGNSLGPPAPGPPTPAANVQSVVVNGGPGNTNVNTLYTTVTVCVPGTTTCQTIDNIQVDTGSFGLRLLAQVVTLSLPVTTAANGNALVECTEFVDGYSWGPVALVDVQIAGESASSVPVQLIGDPRYPTVASDCSSAGPMPEDTVAQFGANGILGIGPFAQDCGSFCVTNIPTPAVYNSCTPSACQGTLVALSSQVPNPVPLFKTDNNGTIISLPSVPASGAATLTGSLIFGIDTQSNNKSGSQTVLTLASSGTYAGLLTTVFNGQTLNGSFIDSGSNGTFFNDPNVAACTNSGFTNFYCPASTLSFQATLQGGNGTSIAASFSVANAEMLDAAFTAFPGLAGPNPTPGSFDWGLPFFFGRRVATAIEGYTTSVGTGPYIAF